MLIRLLCICILMLPVVCARGQYVDPHNLLIRNVTIVEAGQDSSATVSVLIRDNKLDLISKDEFPAPEGVMVVDAEGGFLLGKLDVGGAPSFIILKEDPRTNFDVLLDSGEYVVFAVHDGELRRNNLFESIEEIHARTEDPRQGGWLAYTPPPLALPMSYADTTKWNRWESKYVDGIFVAGVVLDRQRWLTQNDASREQVGDLNDFDGGEIRGLRLGAVGTFNFETPWVYTIFAATNAFDKGFDTENVDDLTFFDYRLDIPISSMTLSVGKQKEPISMERIMSMVQLPMQERTSVSDALLPARNFGAVLSGNLPDKRLTWAGGLFNDWYDQDKSIGSSGTDFVGRGTWLPFVSADESNLVHLGAGIRWSNAKDGVRYATEPEFNNSPFFADTGFDGVGLIDADRTWQYNLEASWRRGPYWLAAEFTDTRVDSPTYGDLDFGGYHLTGSWIVTGEMRAYNHNSGIFGPVPVSRGVYQGGWGAWEVSARYSRLDLSDGPIDGGEMDILSIGLNWWLTPIFNVNANYRYIELLQGGIEGASNGINARVMLLLE